MVRLYSCTVIDHGLHLGAPQCLNQEQTQELACHLESIAVHFSHARRRAWSTGSICFTRRGLAIAFRFPSSLVGFQFSGLLRPHTPEDMLNECWLDRHFGNCLCEWVLLHMVLLSNPNVFCGIISQSKVHVAGLTPPLWRMQAYESEAERWAFLSPWTKLLCAWHVRASSSYANDHTYRVRFGAIRLNLPRARIDSHADAECVRATAEAIELVATALACCPQAWHILLVEQCGIVEHFHPEAYTVEELTPRFEIFSMVYSRATLMKDYCQTFFEALTKRSARSSAFFTALQQIQKLASESSALGRVLPIPIKVVLSSWPGLDHKLADFAELVEALTVYKKSDTNESWAYIEMVSMEWAGLELTTAIVERALALVSYAPFFHVERIALDASKIECSASDLNQFLSTLGETYPSLEMDIGYDAANEVLDGSDVQNACSQVVNMMDAIAQMRGTVKSLNVGLLLPSSEHDERRREVFWHHIFGTLMHPSANCKIETLVFSSHDVLNSEVDARLIREATSAFPDYKQPSSLVLETTEACLNSLHAMIDAFGAKVRHLYLADHGEPIPSSVVMSILRLCPQLITLDIDHVALDSMTALNVLSHGNISTLALSNVVLADRSSLMPFLLALFDSQSSLGGRISEFSLTRSGDPSEHWDKLVLNAHELSLVTKLLPQNPRLHSVRLDVNDDVPDRLINEATREHHAPSAVRHSPLALASKAAFLSATTYASSLSSAQHYLSHDIIAVVFSFAAQCMTRSVRIRKSFQDDGM